MHTIYFWRCTDPITGRRYTTRWRCTQAEAREHLIAPERIEYGALTVEAITAGHSMPSGLVRRDDGAMVGADATASACPAGPTAP